MNRAASFVLSVGVLLSLLAGVTVRATTHETFTRQPVLSVEQDSNALISKNFDIVTPIQKLLPAINFCYGDSLGPHWNQQFEVAMVEVFSRLGVDFRFTPVPDRRKNSMIDQQRCDIFTAVTRQHDSRYQHHLLVDEPLYDFELNVYSYVGQPREFNKTEGTLYERLAQLDQVSIHVGYFRSESLSEFFKQLQYGQAMSLNRLDQGVNLLQRRRIDFYVAPITLYLKDYYLAELQSQIVQMDTLLRDSISLYVRPSLTNLKPELEQVIRQLRRENFSPIFQIN